MLTKGLLIRCKILFWLPHFTQTKQIDLETLSGQRVSQSNITN